MSDFGTMQARIARELRKKNLTTEIKDAIQSAIKHYEGARFWFNELRHTATTQAGREYYPLPSGFAETDSMVITVNNWNDHLIKKPQQWIDRENTTSSYQGIPKYFSNFAQQFRLFPIPDDAYTLTLSNANRLAALVNDTDANAWMTDAEELIRARARADVRVTVLQNPLAHQEMLAFTHEGFYCAQEKAAYSALVSETEQRVSSRKITPLRF